MRLNGDDIHALMEWTLDADPEIRASAVRKLCPCELRTNHEGVWDRILEMASDEDVDVRRQILHLLADGSPRSRLTEVVLAFEGLEQDPDPKLRRRARKVLAVYRRTGKINVL